MQRVMNFKLSSIFQFFVFRVFVDDLPCTFEGKGSTPPRGQLLQTGTLAGKMS